jgi:hypothetical protein
MVDEVDVDSWYDSEGEFHFSYLDLPIEERRDLARKFCQDIEAAGLCYSDLSIDGRLYVVKERWRSLLCVVMFVARLMVRRCDRKSHAPPHGTAFLAYKRIWGEMTQ